MAEREQLITSAQIDRVMAEMRKPYIPVMLGEIAEPIISKTNEYAIMHSAPKSDPNAQAHNDAHDYVQLCEQSEEQIAVWKKEARRNGVEWRVYREQLLDQPNTRTIVMREGAGPGAFARVVETDRFLKKRGHGGDDDKANDIRKEERRIDNVIWAIARQLRD